MQVTHEENDRFTVLIRGHRVVVDQPVEDGGGNAGPTPTELFVAGLGACVAHYARRYLARHALPTAGLGVDVAYRMGSKPARVEAVEVALRLPPGVPEDRVAGLLAVASHCTVHNSLTRPPTVTVDVAGRRAAEGLRRLIS